MTKRNLNAILVQKKLCRQKHTQKQELNKHNDGVEHYTDSSRNEQLSRQIEAKTDKGIH